jgi:hypothetical protein
MSKSKMPHRASRRAAPRCSVTDPVHMWAVRMIGRNVPHTELTHYEDEARGWLVPGSELVRVTITPND